MNTLLLVIGLLWFGFEQVSAYANAQFEQKQRKLEHEQVMASLVDLEEISFQKGA